MNIRSIGRRPLVVSFIYKYLVIFVSLGFPDF